MALKSASTTDKLVSDILDCIAAVKEQFEEDNISISDNDVSLQRLCSKLEHILQNGLKDKTSILGNKKDYWDYFCQCLSSRKYVHDGIRYVKLKSEVKTSKGKGRAFLRFCLVHGCLADTLQQCFVQDAVSKDWYQDWALPSQKEKWPSLISSLYDLSEIRFDLTPDCYDLDVTWPTFSRGVYEQRLTWKPPSRSTSFSSLNSQVQMEHPLGHPSVSISAFPEVEDVEPCSDDQLLKLELDQSEIARNELLQRVAALESTELQLRAQLQKMELAKTAVNSVGEASEVFNHSDTKYKEISTQTELPDELDQTQSHEHWQDKLACFEVQIGDLSSEKEHLLSVISTSSVRTTQLEETNRLLLEKLEHLRRDFEAATVKMNSQSEMEEQALTSENQLTSLQSEKCDLLQKLIEVQTENDNLKRELSDISLEQNELSDEAIKLKCQITVKCDLLCESERRENELNELVLNLQRELETCRDKEKDFQCAANLIFILDTKVKELEEKSTETALLSKITDLEITNMSLSQDLETTSNSFHCQITSLCSEKDELSQLLKKMEESNEELKTNLREKSDVITKVNKQLAQVEQVGNVLSPLTQKQESVTKDLHHNTSNLLSESQKLSDNMKVLASILFSVVKGNYVTMESKEESCHSNESTDVDKAFIQLDSTSSSIVSLVSNSARIVSKLKELLLKNERVEMVLQTCQQLCCDLIGVAREHKKKLALEHFDLAGTQKVVDTLTSEHKKLRTAEAILKHELGEKKKLLSSLRHKLESTHEEWNRSRIKTAQSELEWHSLREEFRNRHKQSSEESGFVDDRRSEEPNSDNSEHSVKSVSEATTTEEALAEDSSDSGTKEPSSPVCDGAECSEVRAAPRSRLDILEEQYQLLYSSLLRSSKRSEVLEQRLEAILGHTESHSRTRASRTANQDPEPQETEVEENSDYSNVSESVETIDAAPSENMSQSVTSLQETDEQPVLDTHILDIPEDPIVNNIDYDEIQTEEGIYSLEADVNDCDEMDRSSVAAAQEESMSDIRKKTLENFVSKIKDEKLARNAKEADMRAQIQVLLSEKLDLEGKVLQLQKEKQMVWSKESEFRKRAEYIFRQERDSFESKLATLSQERSQLTKDIDSLKQQYKQNQDALNSSESALQSSKQVLLDKEAFLNQQIEALKFQMSSESMKYERALKHYNEQESGILEMKERITNQEQLIESLEDSLREIKEERRTEQERQWEELQELQVTLSTRDEECTAMNEELKKTVRELDETRNHFTSFQTTSQRTEKEQMATITHLEGVLLQLKSDNEDLKKQIIKLTKDKDVLWKRSENLSQHQFSPTRDRWMSDSEVTECLNCKSAFSFTVRKHHCRLCGRIFCHACSNYWIMMASSSRRARICCECYTEHIEKTTNKTSEQDGSEEEPVEAVLSFLPGAVPGSASLDSCSVDSLPISHRRDSSPSVMEALLEVNGNNDCSGASPSNSNLDQTFLSGDSKMDFDVISDEEIARSLSACSPYSPVPSPVSGAESEMQMCGTRTIQDILLPGPEGVNGEIWVNAGGSYGIPVLLDQEDVVLMWEFTSDPKSVAFSVTYKEECSESSSQELLLQVTRVHSHLRPVQGHLIAKRCGLYMLVFSNQFSRFMAKKVCYTLKIQNSDEQVQDSN